ncbi:MAG: hypothetical protein ACYSWZ_04165 [Planctomycetota bacterium]|jgi:hypothetical protein
MAKGTSAIARMGLMFAIFVLAVVASLYALGVFQSEAAKEVLFKLMILIGIWTGASLLILVITAMGDRKNS